MFAIVGIPGSHIHIWQHFGNKTQAEQWTQQKYEAVKNNNPAIGSVPTEVVSDKIALKRRWRDGTKIYSKEPQDSRWME